VRPDELSEIVENLRTFGTDVADIEAKKAQDSLPKSIRETLSSFSNTRSGVIILGLDEADGFRASGVSDPAKMASDLASFCSTDMEPPLRPLIQSMTIDGADVIVAEIPELEPSAKPCYYKGAGITRGSYVRVHDGDHRLSSYEVQLLLSGRGQPREDELAVEGSGPEFLDQDIAAIFVDRLRANRPNAFRNLSRTEVLYRSKVLVRDELGAERLSLAGLLALGEYPQEFYPQLMVTFVHYPTVTGGEIAGARFLDNVALEGSIPAMVRDCLAAVRRNMARRSTVSGAGRQDDWEYPETALREALVNALVHRDLSSAARGTQVQVEMYPDRLVVRSPGGLFGPVSLEDLGEEGVSSSRNSVLLKLLEDVVIPGDTRTVCENRGSGIRAMITALRSAGMTAPQFTDRISHFAVEFPNHALLSDEVVSWISSLGERDLSDSQCMALATLKNGGYLDNLTFRSATGIDSRIATTELQDLVARELVTQEGSRRWSRYRLADRIQIAAPTADAQRRRKPADRRREILHALGDETLSRAELALRTGLDNQVVGRWLRILRQEGWVEITDSERPQSKHTRYRTSRSLNALGQAELPFELG
jgi:ATP-dependent DNA helicase RecG